MLRPAATIHVALGEAVSSVQLPTPVQLLTASPLLLSLPMPTFPSEPLFINVGLSSKAVTKNCKKISFNSTDYEKSNLTNLIR